MKKIFVKPANAGLKIRMPGTGAVLPADGAEVPNSSFWLRRIADGDVVGANDYSPVQENSKVPIQKKEGGK
ncbi:conserved hypothetical protein [uncultured Desulfobacterium sp.]|uniref:DUF2635 domain-containing protein n=1 Tax=uncultured Desulfobacterium sp. TaxID=201089 RepID=A0A445MWH7_9BACT|nr:conserved hypothetical protein [uncultured Desulfobacterium sp.]